MTSRTKMAVGGLTLPLLSLLHIGCPNHDHMQHAIGSRPSQTPVTNTGSQQERWARVLAKREMVSAGMTQAQVRELLGNPDEEGPLFEPKIYRPRTIGSSWFYMKDPRPRPGELSAAVVVRFDLDRKVIGVDNMEIRNPYEF